MSTEEPGVYGMTFGPVEVDSSNAALELCTLGFVMVMLIAFKWMWNKVS